jgi:hypothetical protein
MKKTKVRIYKAPDGNGKFINKAAKFLKKAQYGMQVAPTENDVIATILDEITLDPDVDNIVYKLQDQYGLDYNTSLDMVERVFETLYKEDERKVKEEVMDPGSTDLEDEDSLPRRYDYNLNESSVVDDENWTEETGWDDEDEDMTLEEPEMKKGGTVSKTKFAKKIVKGLRKAAEGMQQEESNSADIKDTPVNGRGQLVNDFRRGIKDLGNMYYAKDIYDKSKKLSEQIKNPPPFAQEGMAVEQQDVENPMHHLKAYSESVSDIFKEPYNQTHGAGYEIPQARKGREQRQANRQNRQMNRDWNRAFGDMAAGYFGVPGLPNYLQMVSPQMMQSNPMMAGAGPAGSLIDINYKKGPWWKGTREWSAKGIPAQMFMGAGAMPGYGYMPMGYQTGSSWSNYRTYPGEIIRTTSRVINSAADPGKNNNVTLNNNANTTKPYPGYMELNPSPTGTEMVYDAQGNEVMAISPEEALRRKAEATSSWRAGSNVNNIMPFASEATLVPNTTETSTSFVAPEAIPFDQTIADVGQPQEEWSFRPGEPLDFSSLEITEPRKGYAIGGPVSNPQRDQYGNLQRFIYGGGDDMSIAPIVAYDNNDIQTKNTQDPFMFRDGGLYRFEGEEDSEVTEANTNPFTAINTQEDYNTRMAEERKKWEQEWSQKQQQMQQQMQPQQQQQMNYYSQGAGMMPNQYPTAPRTFGQVMDMFRPMKRDFTWASQTGPIRSLDGRVYQPPVGMMPNAQGQGQPQGQGQGQNPMKAGYMYDYEYTKGPWWKGNQKTMKLTGRWVDPNNPSTLGPVGFNNAPAGSTNTNAGTSNTNANNTSGGMFAKPSNIPQSEWDSLSPKARMAIRQGERKKARNPISDTESQPTNTTTSTTQPVAPTQQPTAQPTNPTPQGPVRGMTPTAGSGMGAMEREEMLMAYGGYMPNYDDLYEFQGTNNSQVAFSGQGPFDPNANTQVGGIGQGLTGPCTEFEVTDPNSPCYDPNYKPKDFEVNYDLNDAKTFSGTNTANLAALAGTTAQDISQANRNAYNENWLKSRTGSDNREPINQLDYRGGYSGLNQRIMSKTQGAGATGFNSVVGNAAFVKKGGQLGYEKGGVYDLTQEQIGAILAAGGQIKFL